MKAKQAGRAYIQEYSLSDLLQVSISDEGDNQQLAHPNAHASRNATGGEPKLRLVAMMSIVIHIVTFLQILRHRGLLLILFLTRAVFPTAAESDNWNCACLPDLDAFGIDNSGSSIMVVAPGGENFSYPSSYGIGCGKHDSGMLPFCDVRLSAPYWCERSWCYVNASACDLEMVLSSTYLEHAVTDPLYLSYGACGSSDDAWSEYLDSFTGTIKLCSVFADDEGIPCGNTAAWLQVDRAVHPRLSLSLSRLPLPGGG